MGFFATRFDIDTGNVPRGFGLWSREGDMVCVSRTAVHNHEIRKIERNLETMELLRVPIPIRYAKGMSSSEVGMMLCVLTNGCNMPWA